MRSKSHFNSLATYISFMILLARSSPIPHISELSNEVAFVNSLSSRSSEGATDHVNSLILAETDMGHVLAPVARSETNNAFERAPLKLSEPLNANGRKMRMQHVGSSLAGWEGIPEFIQIPEDKESVTEEDEDDLVKNFIAPITKQIEEAAKSDNPPSDLKTKLHNFSTSQSKLRNARGFRSLPYFSGRRPKRTSTSIPSRNLPTLLPHPSYPTAPGNAMNPSYHAITFNGGTQRKSESPLPSIHDQLGPFRDLQVPPPSHSNDLNSLHYAVTKNWSP